MQVTETLNEGLKRAYNILLTANQLEESVQGKLIEAQPTFEMKGFRKGKVPMSLLKKQFGQQIMGEVMQESIDNAMKEHFDNTGDRPAQQPSMEMKDGDSWKQGDDVEVSISYERLPDIPEVDFKKIKLKRMVVEVDDKAIKEGLENLAKNAQNFEDRKKGSKSKDGDQVNINFLGKIDGEAFEGGAGEDYPLVLGSNSFIPGFEEQLVGKKAEDKVEVKVSFPEDYNSKNLAGKNAIFDCVINAVKQPKPAVIDDEMAKQFGSEDLKALKEQLKERLGAEYVAAARQLTKRELMDSLDKMVKFELPESLVDAESSQIAHQLWHDENPDVEGHDHPEIETNDEAKKLGERRVRLGLLLAELGRKNEITISDQEMQQSVFEEARKYPGQEKEFFEFVQKNEEIQQQLRAPLFEDKVVNFVFELSTISEKKVSKDELQKAIESED
ncbi:MAG: trigger factor [Rhodobacterales bacterium]|tara:strand:- start:399 stop:1727 length:1329 start_codon:yes stop_codon:yes gene_type:complete